MGEWWSALMVDPGQLCTLIVGINLCMEPANRRSLIHAKGVRKICDSE